MTWATVLQEVRQMRFEELYVRRQRRELTMAEAAEMLGVTERTFRRWQGRYETEGAEGLQDRRLGRGSARAVPVDEALRMVRLYETRYAGWTVKHSTSTGTPRMAGHGRIRERRRPSRPRGMWPGRPGGGRIARSDCGNPCPA
jgi:hypothetical protein